MSKKDSSSVTFVKQAILGQNLTALEGDDGMLYIAINPKVQEVEIRDNPENGYIPGSPKLTKSGRAVVSNLWGKFGGQDLELFPGYKMNLSLTYRKPGTETRISAVKASPVALEV